MPRRPKNLQSSSRSGSVRSASSSRSVTAVKRLAMSAVDLFCGAGGLTRGLLDAGIAVRAGYDTDDRCQYPYEHNNPPAKFYPRSVTTLKGHHIAEQYPKGHVRILVGCAPCVTFSKYTQGKDHRSNPKWSLLGHFARLVRELQPDIVSMENVPELQRYAIFRRFLRPLAAEGFYFQPEPAKRVVYCPKYGVPQHRTRLVVLASRFGPIELVPPTHSPSRYRTASDVIGSLPALVAGGVCSDDPM